MKHINDIELTEYVAGNLTGPRTKEVREHIAACPECSQRRRETDRLWDTLGDWNVETAEHDVADRIVTLARVEQSASGRNAGTHVVRMRLPLQVLRVAASIIIAVGAGYEVGRYSVTGKKPQVAPSQNQPEYLAALGLQWSSGLAWLVLEEDQPDTGGEQ
ncbi:MAG: zf-HC2 domain-containing protein [Planctomycetes bacterium]|nr:zf-HC2 domain-containing protein [Planctomycetota bacterium]MBL7187374.1 zf-HC2 domain-containing protein [Phycisphaerae bacterium]